jgi:hypothetical protein
LRQLVLSPLIPLLLLSSACGVFLWQDIYSHRAPNSSADVAVQKSACFTDCVVRVVVRSERKSTILANQRGCVPEFAHAVWIGSVVGVFVDCSYIDQIRTAYDISSVKAVPFGKVESALSESIIRDYGVTAAELKASGGDVFRWATYAEDGNPPRSMKEFHRRHPD